MIPVVDYKRMERLRPPENTVIPINANTLCDISYTSDHYRFI